MMLNMKTLDCFWGNCATFCAASPRKLNVRNLCETVFDQNNITLRALVGLIFARNRKQGRGTMHFIASRVCRFILL